MMLMVLYLKWYKCSIIATLINAKEKKKENTILYSIENIFTLIIVLLIIKIFIR